MFKIKTIYSLILTAFSINAFAVTEQINFANNFLNQSSLSSIKNDIILLGTNDNGEYSEAQYYQKIKNNSEHNAIAINRDINLKSKAFNPTLKLFQENNNLEVTGVINEETIDFIHNKQDEFGLNITDYLDPNTWYLSYNQPLAWQVKTVQNSLFEWNKVLEKQKMSNSNKFIIVNIPNMRLTAYNWDATTQTATEELATRVVVGSIAHKTPFDDMKIWGIKYNPTWTPTTNIMKRTLFKDGTLNNKWLTSHKIAVFDSYGEKLSYDQITESNFKELRFVQPSGNDNALGVLKFETTSKDNIYLHDTNEKNKFLHNNRAYSSGCIRVDDYLPLSAWLSDNDEEQIVERINKGQTKTLNLPQKVPVYITYTQAYFDDAIPAFAPDIYRKNKGIIYK